MIEAVKVKGEKSVRVAALYGMYSRLSLLPPPPGPLSVVSLASWPKGSA